MKLTSFGFVALAENFLKDSLSAPPSTGGKWSLKRFTNFTENSSSLQVLLTSDSGTQKTSALVHSRMTGAARESSIQGWIQYGDEDTREAFVIKATDINRAEEEIFEIIDQLVDKIPEAQKPSYQSAPKPTPSSGFEPLLPEIHNAHSVSTEEEPFDPAKLIAQMNADAANTATPSQEEPFDPAKLVAQMNADAANTAAPSPAEEVASGPLLSPEMDVPQDEAPPEPPKPAKGSKKSAK